MKQFSSLIRTSFLAASGSVVGFAIGVGLVNLARWLWSLLNDKPIESFFDHQFGPTTFTVVVIVLPVLFAFLGCFFGIWLVSEMGLVERA